MKLETNFYDEAILLVVEDQRIDAANAIFLKDAFAKATSGASGRVIMDLSSVEFMDSSGLGAMVAAMKHLAGRTELELFGLSGAVDKVFTLTRMNTVFKIHADESTALDGLTKSEDSAVRAS